MSVAKNIRVLHIVSGDLWAGAEVQLFTLAKTQHHRSDIQVSVVVLNVGRLEQELRNAGIEVVVLDEARLSNPVILKRLLLRICTLRPDIIHTHRTKENVFGSIVARICGNIPCIRTSHGAPEHRPAWYKIPKHLYQFSDWFCGRFLQQYVIAVSEDLSTILAQDYPAQQIDVIQNGIDIEGLRQVADDSHTVQPFNNSIRVGIAGRLVPVKRVDLFIRAAHAFIERRPEQHIDFYIFGEGPLQAELDALNRASNTGGKVHFEGHSDDMLHDLRELDILMMTSDHEGLPMILLEAMVLQTPIIAHAVGGIPVLLDHGGCGLLVENHTPTGYADALQQLVEQPEERRRIAQLAMEHVLISYSAEGNADAYDNIYRKIIG